MRQGFGKAFARAIESLTTHYPAVREALRAVMKSPERLVRLPEPLGASC